jgi:hypothetical protein
MMVERLAPECYVQHVNDSYADIEIIGSVEIHINQVDRC